MGIGQLVRMRKLKVESMLISSAIIVKSNVI